VGAPTWMVGGWAGVAGDRQAQGVTGMWNVKVAPLAHFVGCPDKAGGLKALGWWDYRSEAVVASFLNQPPPLPMKERRWITLKGPSFEFSELKDFHKHYFNAVSRLIILGILTDRQVVPPPVPCSSKWVTSRDDKAWGGIEQVPYRWEWHAGERVNNGLQTGKCKYRPGPEIIANSDDEMCCIPWVKHNAMKCHLVHTWVELNHVMTENPELAQNADVKPVSPSQKLSESAAMELLESEKNVLYVQIESEEGVPTVDLSLDVTKRVMKAIGDDCSFFRRILREGDYQSIIP